MDTWKKLKTSYRAMYPVLTYLNYNFKSELQQQQ